MGLFQNAVVAAVYLVGAKLGLLWAYAGTNATPVWPCTGIALALCILYGHRYWPGIFLGAFLANATLHGEGTAVSSVLLALGTATGNTVEALVGSWLVRRRASDPFQFNGIRETLRFIVLGALISPLISSTVGTACFHLFRPDLRSGGEMWLTWWLGDVVGVLVFAPPLLNWRRRHPFSPKQWAEAAAWLLVLLLVEAVIFKLDYPLEYLIFPALFWTAFRFGEFAASLAVTLVMLTVLFGTVTGHGPFADRPLEQALLFMQSFIGVTSVSTLVLSMLIAVRGRVEKNLRASEERFRSIFESAPVGIYHSTFEGRFLGVNPALASMFGYGSPAEMVAGINQIAAQLFVDPEKRLAILDRVRGISGFVRDEVTYRRSDSTQFVANLYVRLVSGDDGTPEYLEGFVEDISERKAAEQRLRDHQNDLEKAIRTRTRELERTNEQLLQEIEERKRTDRMLQERENQYQVLVESANSVILRWRPDGTILFFNRFAESFFGYRSEEIVGRNFVGTIVPESNLAGHGLTTLASEIIAHPEAYVNNENENMRKNGERVWIAWTNKPIFATDGTVAEVLSIGNDITQLVDTERELRRTLEALALAKERAEAADHLKSTFLATMSHELRTPLNSIIGFTGLLLQGLAGPLNTEQRKQLTMVKISADHLLSLISDVLDISKIEAGQLTVAQERFSLADAVRKVAQSMELLARKKGLRLEVAIGAEVGEIVSDERRVEQVLLNLLSNAVKFTESGSISLDCRREGRDYVVTVTDTGIGIKPEDAEHLFQPFYQINTGLSRKYEGTGLGLSICRRLLGLMGGSIWLESTHGGGSKFGFRLPVEMDTQP